jgi:hypothetical protein
MRKKVKVMSEIYIKKINNYNIIKESLYSHYMAKSACVKMG